MKIRVGFTAVNRKNIFQKTIDNKKTREYNADTILNNTNNDCDEDGRNVESSESWRLLRANVETFHVTYPFRVGGPNAFWQVDSFRNAA